MAGAGYQKEVGDKTLLHRRCRAAGALLARSSLGRQNGCNASSNSCGQCKQFTNVDVMAGSMFHCSAIAVNNVSNQARRNFEGQGPASQ